MIDGIYLITKNFYASGAQYGILGIGSLYVFSGTFFPAAQQAEFFPGVLRLHPEANVKFSESGCWFLPGAYSYYYI